MAEKQAQKLGLKPYSRLSPGMENNCLLLSANESFQNAQQDLETLCGVKVSHSPLQRLVHRQECSLPEALQGISEVSIDGGKVRLRTPQPGVPSEWRDYKAVRLQRKHFCGKVRFLLSLPCLSIAPEGRRTISVTISPSLVIGLLTITTFLKKACVLLVLGQSSRQLNNSVDG